MEGESCVFEDEFDACKEAGDEDGKKKAVQASLQYWNEVESSNIVPYKMMKSNSSAFYFRIETLHGVC